MHAAWVEPVLGKHGGRTVHDDLYLHLDHEILMTAEALKRKESSSSPDWEASGIIPISRCYLACGGIGKSR